MNMVCILVTLETIQELIVPLKMETSLNMSNIMITINASHGRISPLKEEAQLNMAIILVTLEISQILMFMGEGLKSGKKTYVKRMFNHVAG